MMNRIFPRLLLAAASVMMSLNAVAQEADSSQTKTVITLDDALKIALSENASVQVADKEIERSGYFRVRSFSYSHGEKRPCGRRALYQSGCMRHPGMARGADCLAISYRRRKYSRNGGFS